jgi:hypothetical protein
MSDEATPPNENDGSSNKKTCVAFPLAVEHLLANVFSPCHHMQSSRAQATRIEQELIQM